MDRRLLEYSPELEFFDETSELDARAVPSRRDEWSQRAEMSRAIDFLEISDQEELQQFLADLVAQAGSAKAANPQLARMLVQRLAQAAQTIHPLRAGAAARIDSGVRNPGLLSNAARIFGLELEGLSPEDKEFEVGRHFIRFADDVIANASAAPPGRDPASQVQAAMLQAARRHAPGLLRQQAACASGNWQGRPI